MLSGKKIAAVIPAYNEAKNIAKVIQGLPDFVDAIIVVDDASEDATFAAASAFEREGLKVLRHEKNSGAGAAIITGYLEAAESNADIAVVLAGDNQMKVCEIERVVTPVATGGADYSKGNRLCSKEIGWMPASRRFGNYALTYLTRLATGDFTIMDSQCGFTAIDLGFFSRLDHNGIYPRYGYPNSMLAALIEAGARIAEVEVSPVYENGKSGIRWYIAAFTYPCILLDIFLKRAARRIRSMLTSKALEKARSTAGAALLTVKKPS